MSRMAAPASSSWRMPAVLGVVLGRPRLGRPAAGAGPVAASLRRGRAARPSPSASDLDADERPTIALFQHAPRPRSCSSPRQVDAGGLLDAQRLRGARRARAPASCGTSAGTSSRTTTSCRARTGQGHARRDTSTTPPLVGVARDQDLAVLQIDAPRAKLVPIARRHQRRPAGRPEGLRHRQPLRPRPHADHRHRERARPHDPERRQHRRSTTSSRPTPPSTPATRAGRCSTARAG